MKNKNKYTVEIKMEVTYTKQVDTMDEAELVLNELILWNEGMLDDSFFNNFDKNYDKINADIKNKISNKEN